MKRLMTLSGLRQTLGKTYNIIPPLNDGNIDPLPIDVDPEQFGISVILSDGIEMRVDVTDSLSHTGALINIPVATILLSQLSPENLINKSGRCGDYGHGEKPNRCICHHVPRAVSAIEPTTCQDKLLK